MSKKSNVGSEPFEDTRGMFDGFEDLVETYDMLETEQRNDAADGNVPGAYNKDYLKNAGTRGDVVARRQQRRREMEENLQIYHSQR